MQIRHQTCSFSISAPHAPVNVFSPPSQLLPVKLISCCWSCSKQFLSNCKHERDPTRLEQVFGEKCTQPPSACLPLGAQSHTVNVRLTLSSGSSSVQHRFSSNGDNGHWPSRNSTEDVRDSTETKRSEFLSDQAYKNHRKYN